MEKTSNLYRFELSLPPGALCLKVREEEPYLEEIALSSLAINDFVSYTSDNELSEPIRAGLQQAVALLQRIDEEKNKLSTWQKQLKHLFGEQERTRKNLEATRSQTQQGQYYLNLLASRENEIIAANKAIADFEKTVEVAKQEYDTYIQKMFLEGVGRLIED
jgi:DNA repair exonuclease SbcCD ATPase subunit